jgi:hypothetical protein
MMFEIANYIGFFIIIPATGIFGFANAFWLLGKNQVWFAQRADPKFDENDIPYSYFLGSLRHCIMISLGQFDSASTYFIGPVDKSSYSGFFFGHKMQPFIIITFLLLSFLMCIHLLNMLIAMMSHSFDLNDSKGDSQKTIS